MSLAGKVAIVTGGASGIGFETVKVFLEAGASGVAVVDRSTEALESAKKAIDGKFHEHLLLVQADVTDEGAVQHYVKATVQRFGKLDISAQIAGIAQKQLPVEDLGLEEFEKVMAVNVRGPFLGVKHSVRAMKASPSAGKGCSIVICGSQLGLDGHPNLTAYCASKFAVRGITQTVAAELGACGIRVNTVCPGPIETPMLVLHTPPDQWGTLAGQAMLQRLGKPEEIAQSILFLASDQSAYVTGASLKVDGGFSRFA
ncbi:putative 2,5-dichloro-2,5-cyclohexadiene-1,4-diol dehydrogenase [Cystobasidium minutum MCA 4210]|uniref:putative 2,5-dichloro-2,5-cyclohexadiene-1,4-diol dehydrogenase n=1 Tax=Cystobasidium minutum MCA 4210 TaxID=1397322 RepID=UPI0034CDA98A|eukprot:jgi/Rhomi1/168471/fgenesh1_kg.3_\